MLASVIDTEGRVEQLQKSKRRGVCAALLLICALALSLRIYHAVVAVVVSPDSAVFIAYARGLAAEPLATLREQQQHPLYPGLILLCHKGCGWVVGEGPEGWIVAGRVAAIAGSLCAVLALYWFTARLYDRKRALIAAGLLAVLPDACRNGADVLSDLPHLALYLSGLTALFAGMQTRRARFFVTAGGLAALAFLTRPEGAAVLLVGAVAIALHRDWPAKSRARLAGAMAVTFFCLAGPYQLATGQLVQKKSLRELLGFDVVSRLEAPASQPGFLQTPEPENSLASSPAAVATTLPTSLDVLRQWFRAGRVVYILLAILGLVVAAPRGVGARILGGAIGVHLILLYALESSYGYLDRRHALILAACSLPPAAAGVWWLASKLSAKCGGKLKPSPIAFSIGIVFLCVLATSPWLLRPIHAGNEHVMASARWLRQHTRPGTLIVGDRRQWRVALCADRPFAEWPWWQGGVHHLAEFLEDEPSCYFLVDVQHMSSSDRNPFFFEQLERRFGPLMELVHSEAAPPSARSTEIRVYRYVGGG